MFCVRLVVFMFFFDSYCFLIFTKKNKIEKKINLENKHQQKSTLKVLIESITNKAYN